MNPFAIVMRKWDIALAVAFLFFGVFAALNTIEGSTIDGMFIGENNRTVLQKGQDFAIMAVTFGAVTPAYRYEIPFYNGYIVGINDIPYLDASDFIFLIPLLLLTKWITQRIIFHPNKFYNFFILLLIFLLVLVVGFLAVKHIQYKLYLHSAENLGLDRQAAIDAREGVLLATEELSGIFALLAFFMGAKFAKRAQSRFG